MKQREFDALPKLGHADIKRIQNLLKSKQPAGVHLAMSLLQSLGAAAPDYEAVLTEPVIKSVLNSWVTESWRAVAEAIVPYDNLAGLFLRLAEEQFDSRPPRKHSAFDGLLQARLPAARAAFLKTWGNEGRAQNNFLDLVEIPAGSFMMGSPDGEDERGGDEKLVSVRITSPFRMALTVITQSQWTTVMGSEPWRWARGRWSTRFKSVGCWKRLDANQCGATFPAVDVSWEDAELFCKTLTELERQLGRLTAQQEYLLPTEAEWEYACRAGTTTAWSFGDDPEQLGEYGWFFQNANGQLHRVGERLPNPWGLFDMHGNVQEWCADWYAQSLPGGDDPAGPPSGKFRVCRGGSWGFNAAKCRSAARDYSERWSNFAGRFGFRVVLRG
jgi:formylglycine-generating enzyme required for sulfatase activity